MKIDPSDLCIRPGESVDLKQRTDLSYPQVSVSRLEELQSIRKDLAKPG